MPMKKKLNKLILPSFITLAPFSAYAIAPANIVGLEAEVGKIIFALISGFLILAMVILFSKTDIEDITNGLSELGYNQRVYTCNLYAEAFDIRAKTSPEEIWDAYSYIWKKRPHLFDEGPSKTMLMLEEKFG